MPTLKPKKLLYATLLAGLGAGYFVGFSGIEAPSVLKTQLVLLPIQIGALIYLLWWRQQENKSSSLD